MTEFAFKLLFTIVTAVSIGMSLQDATLGKKIGSAIAGALLNGFLIFGVWRWA